ncbi:MAG: alpha/beta fold hydrolase [Sphingomonadaceae bacterium]|nr:alpha/beta fold hydrolase [Sphingomonadaceae bacterium]
MSSAIAEAALADLHLRRVGSGRPVLFLTGVGGRTEFWEPQIDRLRNGFECISFDHRPGGDPLPDDPRDAAAFLADYALRVMDSLALESPDVVGHSFGAAIAQHLAVHAPKRVGKLALSSAWAGPCPMFMELFRLRKQVLKNCGPHEYYVQAAFISNPGWWNHAHFDAIFAGAKQRADHFHGADVECHRMDSVTGHDLRGEVGRIVAETLIIAARDDIVTPLTMSEELAELIPGARLEILDTGGHMSPMTVPDGYAQKLMSFLSR